MPEWLSTGLFLLVAGALFTTFFVINKRAGKAEIRHWAMPDDPLAYWFMQIFFGVIGFGSLLGAVLVLTGLTPP